MQGVVKAYDPSTGMGVLIDDVSLRELELADDALQGSLLRMLRQGQRVVFDLDGSGLVTRIRLGSEADMRTPGFEQGAQG